MLPGSFCAAWRAAVARLNELWPVFNKKLVDPDSTSNPRWQRAQDYDPANHVLHYALPAPGRMEDLLTLVTRAHERLLDRGKPLWELHLIEGLQGGRFAMYCKVHHALVDGVGALRMVDALFSTSPDERVDFRAAKPRARDHQERISLVKQFDSISAELKKHYKGNSTGICPAGGHEPGCLARQKRCATLAIYRTAHCF